MAQYSGNDRSLGQKLKDCIREKKNKEALHILTRNVNGDDLKGEMGEELLRLAVHNGNDVITQHLINVGVNVNVLDRKNRTPLDLALDRSTNENIIKILLDAKANIFHDDCNTLKYALTVNFINHWNVKSLFLERLKSDCLNSSEVIAEKLLLCNVKLCYAALLKDVKILSILLSCGVSISDPDYFSGKTALHVAVTVKDLDSIKFLLANGADINDQTGNRLTPLALACDYDESAQEYEILNYLFEQGTCLSLILHGGLDQISYILRRGKTAIVRTLLKKYEMDFNFRDKFGKTDLHYMSMNIELSKGPSIIKELKQCQFNVNVLNDDGNIPLLSAAATLKNSWLASFLLESGVNVNHCNIENVSALHLATQCSSYLTRDTSEKRNIYNLVELLLQYGADPQVVTTTNQTVFDNIIREKSYDLAKPILAYLLLHKERGGAINGLIRIRINSNKILKREFERCQKDLEEIKRIGIHNSVTGLNLILYKERKIRLIARNQEVFDRLTELYSIISRDPHYSNTNLYLSNMLKHRLKKIISGIKIRGKASIIMCRLLSADYYAIPDIIDKIIDYFDDQDLQNIIQV